MEKGAIQPFLFETPTDPLRISLYMDSSGQYGQDEWIAWGMLLVREQNETSIVQFLNSGKRKHNCDSVLHFSDLPGSWGGEGGHKPKTIFTWLKYIPEILSNDAWFYCFAVHVQDPRFKHNAFTRPFHLHNRFTRMTLTSAIPWFFKGTQTLQIDPTFHRQTFDGSGYCEDGKPGQDWDNLGTYITTKTLLDARHRREKSPHRWPEIQFSNPVRFLSMDPNEVESDNLKSKCELLQLTDILVGCARQAIDGKAERQTKLELASIVGEWMADVRLKPWEQTFRLHRRFGVSYFPGSHGPTQEGPLRLSRRLPGASQDELEL